MSSPNTALVYLEKAVKAISPLKLSSPDAAAPVLGLINELQVVDEQKAIVIARTLQQSTVFNEAVRSLVSDISIGTRYEDITNNFNSIINDSRNMLRQVEENRNGVKEKFGRAWMKLTRGSIHSRFNKIKDIYLDVSKDTADQLAKEQSILEAYMDYRCALKEAEINAAQLFKIQEVVLEKSKTHLVEKVAAVTTTEEPEAKLKAQLARDEAQRAFEKEDRRYQLVKNVSEQLTIAYNVGDIVMANLNQTRSIKQQVYEKSVTFFTTNESTFTALETNFLSTAGLNESAKTLGALQDSANQSLKVLAEVNKQVKMDGIKMAYGSTIKADSVKALIDSMVSFQTEAKKAIIELRADSAKNAADIATIVDEGKESIARLTTGK
jgi:uncharacterized protein YfcZ (UPF0381/DUF406 family)